jgi:hypothetical protein
MKKNGLQMVMTVVILMILSIAAVAALVVILNSQTGFLSKWIKGQQSESNVDFVISTCNNFVASGSTYSYCCEVKEITFGDKLDEEGNKRETLTQTCKVARVEKWSSERIRVLDCGGIVC